MDKHARARQLFADLGETLNIEKLTLEESDTSCVLFFEGDIVLNIEFDEDTGCMVLSCYLGELPETNAEPLLREVLGANLYGLGTKGATLGLEEATDGVILCQSRSVAELDRQGFEALIETFVDEAEKWSRRFADKASGTNDTAATSASGTHASP